MKKTVSIALVFLLVICFSIYLMHFIENDDGVYNRKMQKLESSSVSGILVVCYKNKEDIYTTQYVPKGIMAQKPEEAGYLLKLSLSDNRV